MKKIPPWALVAGAVAIGALVWLLRKRKQEQAEKEQTEHASEAPQVPGYAEEGEGGGYPYSVGGYGGGGGALGNAIESQSELQEIFKSEQTFISEQGKQQGEFEKKIEELLNRQQSSGGGSTIPQGSGGGAPEEPRPGVTPAPPTPPKSKVVAESCPNEFPLHNPADGPVSPHSCYKYSRARCPEPNIYKHVYWDGHVVCSPT